MNEIDLNGRKVPPEVMDEIRVRAVAAVQRGHSPEQVMEIFGFSRSCIYLWLARFKEGGYEALRTRSRSGRPRLDDEAIRAKLRDTVLQSTPLDWGYETALWNRAILAELLSRWFEVEVAETTVGNWLHELGLSPQEPLWRAQDQNPVAVQQFKECKFPAIVRLAKKMGAEIYFVDEFGYSSRDHAGRTWGLTGQTPVVRTSGQNFRWNVLSGISLQGHLRFKLVEGTVTSEHFMDFLRTLVESSPHPIIVLVDRHKIHTTPLIRNGTDPWRQRFKLYRFPAYSPELNPDEEVPNEMKNHAVGKQPFRNKLDLKAKLKGALHGLQKQTERVRSFFQTPDTDYILDSV